jgi:hypothetical protein
MEERCLPTTVSSVIHHTSRTDRFLNRPEHMRCLMGYVVDLTLIQQAIFLASLQHPLEEKDLEDRVNEIIYEFCCSGKKDDIHNEIREFVATQDWHSEINVVNKIESLIKANEVWRLCLAVILLLNEYLPCRLTSDSTERGIHSHHCL